MRFVLLLQLLAGNYDFVRIDNDNEISAIDVGGERRLVLAAQQNGGLRRDTAQGLAGGVDDLNALGKVLHGAGVLDLAVVVDENEGVLDRLGTGTVDELAANDCILSGHGSSLWIHIVGEAVLG